MLGLLTEHHTLMSDPTLGILKQASSLNCKIIDRYRLRIIRSIQLPVNTVPLPVNIYPSK